jgi:hypothetical protein
VSEELSATVEDNHQKRRLVSFHVGDFRAAAYFCRAPVPTTTQSGDIVMFETNVIYGESASQIAYTLSLGRPIQIEKMFDFCGELYLYALAELEKKRNFGDIERSLVDRIRGAGYEPMTPQMHVYNMGTEMPASMSPQPGDYFTVHPNFCLNDFTAGQVGDAFALITKVERRKNPGQTEYRYCH